MSDENVIKEAVGADGRTYRVRLVDDASSDEPYDDGAVPLWRIDGVGFPWRVEQVGITSFDASDVEVGEAVRRFGHPTAPEVERWLKAFHGATVVETWHSGSSWYLAADTAKWREAMGGVTPEQIREQYARGSLMSEYQHWVNGEVYGYIVERRAVEYTIVTETNGEVIGTRRQETWIEVPDGSLYGLYGYEWAKRMAEDDLADHLGES